MSPACERQAPGCSIYHDMYVCCAAYASHCKKSCERMLNLCSDNSLVIYAYTIFIARNTLDSSWIVRLRITLPFFLCRCSWHIVSVCGWNYDLNQQCSVIIVPVSILCLMSQSYYFTHESGGKILWWARLCVCPSGYLQNHMHDLYQFFCACCLWPWLSPPAAGWQNPKGRGQFWDFPFPWQCIATRSLQITSCGSRTDHSVAAGGWWECTAWAKCDLRLPCISLFPVLHNCHCIIKLSSI